LTNSFNVKRGRFGNDKTCHSALGSAYLARIFAKKLAPETTRPFAYRLFAFLKIRPNPLKVSKLGLSFIIKDHVKQALCGIVDRRVAALVEVSAQAAFLFFPQANRRIVASF
jgi:hypothetical protein